MFNNNNNRHKTVEIVIVTTLPILIQSNMPPNRGQAGNKIFESAFLEAD